LLAQDNVQANKLNVTTVELLGKGYETWAPRKYNIIIQLKIFWQDQDLYL